jgi:Ca2+:H+ antiporter
MVSCPVEIARPDALIGDVRMPNEDRHPLMRNMARVTPLATTAAVLRGESAILAGFATTAILWRFGHHLPAPEDGSVGGGIAFAWIFAVMLWGTFAVVRHADSLAERLGEPFGTLILTISATAIEVTMISTVMLHGANNPTLARDTMFAVLMIVLNGMAGLTLLVGALRHREQYFNLQGAGAFLNLLVPLSVLSLVLPNYTTSSAGATLSASQELFLVTASVTLYGIFLTIQTVRHQGYFQHDHGNRTPHHAAGRAGGEHAAHRPSAWHALGIVAALLPVVLLAEELAAYVDHAIEHLGAPAALGGLLIAGLILAPEALGALRAAWANHLQRSINICLGSALATIGLTVPAVLVIGLVTGRSVELGLDPLAITLLALTLLVSLITFASGHTNVLQGAVHLMLFLSYVFLTLVP